MKHAQIRRAERGYTLIEMLTATAVSSVLLVGVSGAVIGQQRAQAAEVDVREAAASARLAISFLEKHLGMAGYGIDPQFGFLFRNAPASDNGGQYGILEARNSLTAAVGSDILEFQYRDPGFLYRGTAAGSTIQLGNAGDATDPATLRSRIPAGTRLLLLCPGAQNYAYVRVTAEAQVGANSIAMAPVDFNWWSSTKGYVANAGINASFPAGTIANPCFNAGGGTSDAIYITRVLNYRVFIRNVLETRNGITRQVPYLMLSEGLLNGSDEIETPLARGIEDFQVAYVMNPPPTGTNPANHCNGQFPSELHRRLTIGDFRDRANCAPDPTDGGPSWNDDYAAPGSTKRSTSNPANIRRVRVTLSALGSGNRASDIKEQQGPENSPGITHADPRYRLFLTTTVVTSNLLGRSMFTPPVAIAGGTNVWGG